MPEQEAGVGHVPLWTEWTQRDILSTWLAPQGLRPPEMVSAEIGAPGPLLAWGHSGREGGSQDQLAFLLRANRAARHLDRPCPDQSLQVLGRPPLYAEELASQAASPAQGAQVSRFWGFDLTRWLHLNIDWSHNL